MARHSKQSLVEPRPFPENWRWLLDGYVRKSTLVLTAAAWLGVLALFIIPADAERVAWLGLSRNRLLMAAFLLAVSAACALGAARWKGREEAFFSFYRSERTLKTWFINGCAILFAFCLGIFLSPGYRLRGITYINPLLPLIVWTALLCWLCLLPALIFTANDNRESFKRIASEKIQIGREFYAIFLVLVLTAVIILGFGLGQKPDIQYWNENGMPLLLTQIILAVLISQLLLAGIKCLQKEPARSQKHEKAIDIVLFILIWISAALLLVCTPAERTFFSPGPTPPNYVFYPVSDALTYDLYAQHVLLGEGFAGGGHLGKPLLAALLTLFHMLAGGDYARFYMVQAAGLALLPAVMYLIGNRLQGRTAGLLAAMFSLFVERNAYLGMLYLGSSHSKLIMSEVPAALCLALAVYFMARGFSRQQGFDLTAAGISAGAISLSTLVRENTLILVPLPFLFLFLSSNLDWKKKVVSMLALAVFLLAAVAPWSVRTYHAIGTPLFFAPKIQTVILQRRLQPLLENESSSSTTGFLAEEGIPLASSSSAGTVSLVRAGTHLAFDGLQNESPQPAGEQEPLGLGEAIAQHFFHNLITSFAVLPVSLQLEDLTHAAQDCLNPFPGMDENMHLKPGTWAAIAVNLALLALGVAVAWKREGLGGLAPLAVYLGYGLALAVARSSGGRYIVVMNWVLLLYYAIGLACCLRWTLARLGNAQAARELCIGNEGKGDQPHFKNHNPFIGRMAGLLVIFGLGLLIPLTELIFPRRYTQLNDPQAIERLYAEKRLPASIYQTYQRLSAAGDMTVLNGRLLYPRFYDAGEQIIRKPYGGFRAKDYPRLHFFLLGGGSVQVILPLGELPKHVPDSADAYAFGCQRDVFYARLVLVHDQRADDWMVLEWDDTQPDPCLESP